MAAVAWDLQAAEPCAPRTGLRLVTPDAGGHPRPSPAPPAVYRRRQVVAGAMVVVAAVAVVMAVALVIAAPAAPGSQSAGAGAEPLTVVVAPGETVWDLAAPHAPAGVHPMAYVVEVAAYNDVDPRMVQPGTVLELPSAAD